MATSYDFTRSYHADASGTITDATDGGATTIWDTDPDASAALNTSGTIDASTSGFAAFSGGSIIKYETTDGGDVLVTDGTNYYVLSNSATAHNLGDTPLLGAETSAAYTYCFLSGTQISTPTGSIAVEELNIDDEVLTVDGKVAKVRFNFSQVKSAHIFAGKKHFPVKISAGALADNVPSADLYVTPDHAMYFPELNIFAEASTLVNGVSIYQMTEMPETFTYYHILCDNQEVVLSNDTPAETFIDNATMSEFDNYADYAAMYPHAHDMMELDIPRAKAARQLPRALKQQLADRAQLLFPSTLSQAA